MTDPPSEPERRYIAYAAALGAEIERLSAENRLLTEKLGHFERAAQERLRLTSYRVDL